MSHTELYISTYYGIIFTHEDPECETGEIRLVGGEFNSTGRLEVCVNNIWGNVCDGYRYWGPENARVVCRQLGFSEDGKMIVCEPV